jgi:hypothetical protein
LLQHRPWCGRREGRAGIGGIGGVGAQDPQEEEEEKDPAAHGDEDSEGCGIRQRTGA